MPSCRKWLAEQPADMCRVGARERLPGGKQRVLALPGRRAVASRAHSSDSGRCILAADLKLWHAAGLADRLPPHDYHLARRSAPARSDAVRAGLAGRRVSVHAAIARRPPPGARRWSRRVVRTWLTWKRRPRRPPSRAT